MYGKDNLPKVIVDYWIHQNTDWECLSEEIKEWIGKGWQPYGFPVLNDRCCYQTMVKYKD